MKQLLELSMHGAREIIGEAAALPVEERVFVIDSLLRTLNPPDREIDRAWVATAKRRLQELRAGRVQAVPAKQVLAALRKQHQQ